MGWHMMVFFSWVPGSDCHFLSSRGTKTSHVYWSYAWPNSTDLIIVFWICDFLRKPTNCSKCKLKRQYKLQIIRQHPVRICLLHLNQSCPGTKLQNTEEWQRRTHQQRSIDYQWCLWIQMTKVCFSLEKNKWIRSKSRTLWYP